ncbi:hypothetical protein [Polymorphospora rubra]|uniref:hypothetical protein n=1 Tax=Polymorphospora rubra TaxID=338584 RepID=UPI0033CBAB56
MDPITAAVLAATVVPLASGAAGEAGRQAWVSLTAFLRTRFGQGAAPAAAAAVERQPDAPRAQVLATHLVDLAEHDQEFGQWLRVWLRDATRVCDQQRSSTNIVGGQAQITGNLVQTQTIVGSLNFGAPPTPPQHPTTS